MRSEDLAGHQRTQTQDSGGGNVAPEPESQGQGTFTDLPRATTPDLPPLRDFPILSQIHAEVGTMASVVDQINHITNFIHGIPPGERTVTSPPRETVPPEAAPATIAPGQPPSPASQQTQAQLSISPQSSAETVPAPVPEATVDLPGPSKEETKLSAFPIGSLVKLNSGASGRVVGTDETSPLRPDIQILYDAQGRAVSEDRVIKLREYSYGKHDSMETGHPIIRYYRRTLRHATEAWASTKKFIINQGQMFGVDLAPILEGADAPPTEPDDRPRSSMARVGGILLWIVMSLIILAGILWQIGFVRLSARQTGDRIEILRALSNPLGIEDPTKATPTYATSTAPASAADTMGDRQKKVHENSVLPISSSSSVPLSASDPVSGTEPGPMEVNAGGFGVHLGSYRTRRSAERQVSTWKKHGLDTTVQIKQIPGRGTFFRLVAGPYPRFSAADSVAMRLRNQSWRPYARPIRIP